MIRAIFLPDIRNSKMRVFTLNERTNKFEQADEGCLTYAIETVRKSPDFLVFVEETKFVPFDKEDF